MGLISPTSSQNETNVFGQVCDEKINSEPENNQDFDSLSKKPSKKKKNQEVSLKFGTIINSGHVAIMLPLRTESEAQTLLSKTRFYKNGKAKPEHWTEKHARHKKQKTAVYLSMIPIRKKILIPLPCVVKFTRYASHFLDEDENLRMAFKWIKDYVASMLTDDFVPGRADGDKRIKWQYDQIKSKTYAVKIEITW